MAKAVDNREFAKISSVLNNKKIIVKLEREICQLQEEMSEIAELELYLDEIPDYLAIGITTEYERLKLEFMNREDIDG